MRKKSKTHFPLNFIRLISSQLMFYQARMRKQYYQIFQFPFFPKMEGQKFIFLSAARANILRAKPNRPKVWGSLFPTAAREIIRFTRGKSFQEPNKIDVCKSSIWFNCISSLVFTSKTTNFGGEI